MVMDWLANISTYTRASPFTFNAFQLAPFDLVIIPLTLPMAGNSTPDASGYPELTQSMEVLRVMGSVHAVLHGQGGDVPNWADTFWLTTTFRITTWMVDPLDNTELVLPTQNWDLETSHTANDRFLWERRMPWYNIGVGFWDETPAGAYRPQTHQNLYVDCRPNRTLNGTEVLALMVQFSDLGINAGFDPEPGNVFCTFVPRLRTLVKTK